MKVVSNTSPLIFLSNVDSLDLLSLCFDKVFIPEKVKTEFGNDELPETIEIQSISSEGKNVVDIQYGALHRGELEAIQLAYETSADLVLLDDLLARKKAKQMNMAVMGTLGVFLTSSYNGNISPKLANQKIDILINEFDMFVAKNLLKHVKNELKEIEHFT